MGAVDLQRLRSLVAVADACTPLAPHATNRSDRTEAVGEVSGLAWSPAFLALDRTGIGAVSYRECLFGTGRISVASRSATPPTRLETRTKEFYMGGSHWVD